MANDFEEPLLMEYSARFGMKALDMGFATLEQVLEALSEQVMDNYVNKRHRLLGEIFVEKGWMTLEQTELVLKRLSEDKKRIKTHS